MERYNNGVYNWAKDNSAISGYRWVILDQKKADELHIELAEIDQEHSILCIDSAYAMGMGSDEFLEYIQKEGIVANKS